MVGRHTVTAHRRSYQVLDQKAPGTGLAPGKVVAAAALGRAYEQPLLEHIAAQGYTGVAVDAGANVGGHSLWMAVICDLQVHAFEPVAFTELRANVRLNAVGERVAVHPVALGDRPGWASLVGDGTLRMDMDGGIPVHTLDSYGLTDVALIKADVEGMEPRVLRGATDTIRRWRPVVYAEQWTGAEQARTAAVLEPLDYELAHVFTGRQAATPVGQWIPRGT